MLVSGTITTGAVRMPSSQALWVSGSAPVDAQKRATSSGVSSTRNAHPWRETRVGRALGVLEHPVDDGRVDRPVGVAADHPATAYDLAELHGASLPLEVHLPL